MVALLIRAVGLACRGHHELVLENLALRQQLHALKRTTSRPQLRTRDRLFWVILARTWRNWRSALVLVRPDTVVTFGPEGMTGHEDHQTMSQWVTEAWLSTGCRSALWYATVSPDFHDRWGSINEKVGFWFENAVPPVTAQADLAAQIHLADELLTTKYRALRAHTSQTRPLEALIGTEDYRQWWSTESFVAASRPEVA